MNWWLISSRYHKKPKTWIHVLDEKTTEEVAESTLSSPPLFSPSSLLFSPGSHMKWRERKSEEPIPEKKHWVYNSGHHRLQHLKEQKSCTQKAYMLASVYEDFNPRDTTHKSAGWFRKGIVKLDRKEVQRKTAVPRHCTANASTHLGNWILLF